MKYQVYCKADYKGFKWQKYSSAFDTAEAAEKCKEDAENTNTISVDGHKIIYKVKVA